MKSILPLVLGLIVVTGATPAMAGGALTTPLALVSGAKYGVCVVTNVGSTAAAMQVTIKNGLNSTIPPDSDNCPVAPATLAAGQSCWLNSIPGEDVFCSFVGKGKFRAAVQVFDPMTGVVYALPATAK